MLLGTKVGVGPGDIVLDGDPAPLQKGHSPPVFSPCLLWPNGRASQLLLNTCKQSGEKREMIGWKAVGGKDRWGK